MRISWKFFLAFPYEAQFARGQNVEKALRTVTLGTQARGVSSLGEVLVQSFEYFVKCRLNKQKLQNRQLQEKKTDRIFRLK